MKNLLLGTLTLMVGAGVMAQDKKVQIGLVLGPTFNATKIQTTKLERNGIGSGFTVGIGGDYMFNANLGLSSGIQFDLESFKINYGSNTNTNLGKVYYAYSDTDIKKYDVEKDQTIGAVEDFTDTTAFQLMTRKFRAKYITLPIFLKFQTNKIGSFIYYGKFGLRTSILAGIRMDDTGFDASYDVNDPNGQFTTIGTAQREQTNMKPETVKKGLSLIRTGIGIYGGTQWNFTGTTYLYGEFGFNYGITPVMYQRSSHLVDKVEDTQNAGVYSYNNIDVKNNPQHIFELKIGLLF